MASVDLIELLLEEHYRVGVSDWAKMNGWDFTSWKWWPEAESNPEPRIFSTTESPARQRQAEDREGFSARPTEPPHPTEPIPNRKPEVLLNLTC